MSALDLNKLHMRAADRAGAPKEEALLRAEVADLTARLAEVARKYDELKTRFAADADDRALVRREHEHELANNRQDTDRLAEELESLEAQNRRFRETFMVLLGHLRKVAAVDTGNAEKAVGVTNALVAIVGILNSVVTPDDQVLSSGSTSQEERGHQK